MTARSGKARSAEVAARRAAEAARRAAAQAARTPARVAVDATKLAPYNSYGEPVFVSRGYYEDQPFTCVDCGKDEVWRATQQRWWYEVARGDVWSVAIRCRVCRQRRRQGLTKSAPAAT